MHQLPHNASAESGRLLRLLLIWLSEMPTSSTSARLLHCYEHGHRALALDLGTPMKLPLEKLGTIGALLAAIVCPICFPKLALIGAALGLGALAPFEGWFAAAAQVFLVLAVMGHLVAYRRHRSPWVPLLAGVGAALVLGALWVKYNEALVYLGLLAVVAATVWSVFALRKCSTCSVAVPANTNDA